MDEIKMQHELESYTSMKKLTYAEVSLKITNNIHSFNTEQMLTALTF